jgi:hypothetical protein
MKTVTYRKSYDALIEDKGRYFGVRPISLHKYVHTAGEEAKKQYRLTDTDLTLFYTVITARKN